MRRAGALREAQGRAARGSKGAGRTVTGSGREGVGARDVGDQGVRRAWREGLTGLRARWWDLGVVAMDARARAGGGGRTARARGGVGGGERGSCGVVSLFGECVVGRGRQTPEIGEYARGKRPTTMLGFGATDRRMAACRMGPSGVRAL